MMMRLSVSDLQNASDKMYLAMQALNALQPTPLSSDEFPKVYGYDALDKTIHEINKSKPKDSDIDNLTLKSLVDEETKEVLSDVVLPSLPEYALAKKNKRKSRRVPVEVESKKNSIGTEPVTDSKYTTVIEAFLNCEEQVFKKLFNGVLSDSDKSPEANVLRGIITLTNDLTKEEMDDVIDEIVVNLKEIKGQSADKRMFAIKAAIALLSFSNISNLHAKASSKLEEKKQGNNKQIIPQKMLLPFLQMAAGDNINVNAEKNILDLAIQYYSTKSKLNPAEEREEQKSDLAKDYKSFLRMLFKLYLQSDNPFNYHQYGLNYHLNTDDKKESHGALIHFGQAFLKLGQEDKNEALFVDVINDFVEEMNKRPLSPGIVTDSVKQRQLVPPNPEELAQEKIADMFLSPLFEKIAKYDDVLKDYKKGLRGYHIYNNPKYLFLTDFREKILDYLRGNADQKTFFNVIEAISAIDEFYAKAMSMPNKNDPLDKYYEKAVEKCHAVYPESVDRAKTKSTLLKIAMATLALVAVGALVTFLFVYAFPLVPVIGAAIALSLKPAAGVGFLFGATAARWAYDKTANHAKEKSTFHDTPTKSALTFFKNAKKIHDSTKPGKKESKKKQIVEGMDGMFKTSVVNKGVMLS